MGPGTFDATKPEPKQRKNREFLIRSRIWTLDKNREKIFKKLFKIPKKQNPLKYKLYARDDTYINWDNYHL